MVLSNLKMKSQHKDSLKRFDDLNSLILVENKELAQMKNFRQKLN